MQARLAGVGRHLIASLCAAAVLIRHDEWSAQYHGTTKVSTEQ